MDFFSLVKTIYNRIPNINVDDIKDLQRLFAKENKMKDLPSKSQILQCYFSAVESGKLERKKEFESLLRKRAVRSLSGIVPVQVLTKPWPCPGQCIFCPNDPGMPKSYIKSEPGAMRAWLNQFDPMKQVYNRLQSLTITGHQTDKVEMIILGGSWDAYPRDYKIDFVKQLYDACNTFSDLKIGRGENEKSIGVDDKESKYHFEILNQSDILYSSSLENAIKRNESAAHRIIGLTIETRPDLVCHENCKFWRELGVTRVEMGIQSTNDEVLLLNKRGHTVQKIKDAIYIMRQYGLKISVHLMPGLYGSDFDKDIQSFKDMFSDPDFQPDELKFYPTSVIPNTELYDLYKAGKYIPLTTEDILKEIRETFLYVIPPYTRIKRLIRDIPATEIIAGSSVTNLSQIAHESLLKEMKESCHGGGTIDTENFYKRLYGDYILFKDEREYLSNLSGFSGDSRTEIIGVEPDLKSFRNFVCLDTRSREVRNRVEKKKNDSLNLILRWYKSSAGQECFISYEDELGYIYGFTRLLLPNEISVIGIDGLETGTAIIRELHVYGELQKIGEKGDSATQHTGLGKNLLRFAESISKTIGYNQLSVISGVGVREYYEKQGFALKGTYMSKKI